MKVLDYTKIAKKYKGEWVAFLSSNSTKVVGHGKTLRAASLEASKKGYEKPYFCRMPQDVNAIYVGGFKVI